MYILKSKAFVRTLVLAVAVSLCVVIASAGPRADSLTTAVVVKVVSPEGKPLAGASVWIRPLRVDGTIIERTTDAAGSASATVVGKPWNGFVAYATAYADGCSLFGGELSPGENTLALGPGVPVRGIVKDASGKPLAGVAVRLHMVRKEDQKNPALPPESSTIFRAVSGPDGRFEIPGGAAGSIAHVEIADPRYVSVATYGTIDKTASLTLVARPGATIIGRLLFADGKPAAGVSVFAVGAESSDMYAQAVTDSEGRYSLGGLSTGKAFVEVDSDRLVADWVAAALQDVAVTETATVTAPDIVMTHGALVTGTVTDDTGKPMADVAMASYGPHRPQGQSACLSTTTDASGHYTLRVAPGKSMLYVQGVPSGFVREPDKYVTLAEGESGTLDFKLDRGVTVNGQVVDEQGKPLAGVNLTFGLQYGWNEPTCVTASDGTFHAAGLDRTDLVVGAGDAWSVLSGGDINTTNPPTAVKIVLRKVETTTVSGLVRAPHGKPVVGIDVGGEMQPVGGAGLVTELSAQSDSAGRYTFKNVPTGRSLTLEIKKPGYKLKSGGSVTTLEAGGYSISDAVVAALDGVVTGKVFDRRGRPAAGALVASPDADGVRFATTGRDGAFKLADLTEGAVTIFASTEQAYGAAIAQTGAPVALRLGAPSNASSESDAFFARKILDGAVADSAKSEFYARNWLAATLAPTDRNAAYALAEKCDGLHGQNARGAVIGTMIESGDKSSADWITAKIATLPDGQEKKCLLTELGMQNIASHPDVALKSYQQDVGAVGDPSQANWYDLVRLIVEGTKLGAPNADRFFDVALAKARTSSGSDGDESLDAFVQLVGTASEAMAMRAVALLPEDNQHNTRADMLAQIAREMADDNPAEAVKLLHEAGASPLFYGITAVKIVDKTAKQDPTAALRLARSISDPGHEAVALATVATLRPVADRAALYEEAFGLGGGDLGPSTILHGEELGPWIAAVAYQTDPAQGRVLFEKARSFVDKPKDEEVERKTDLAYAFYASQLAPGESRLRIERDFAKMMAGHEQPWLIIECPMAMVAINPERAYEMAKQIPGPASFEAQRKIAQYLLADKPTQRTLRFDRWSATDTWTPGTPTDW